MKLYYSPFACSLASHIALREAGQNPEMIRVTLASKVTEAGDDFRAVSPRGYVPALVLDDGTLLTENPAVLQFIADRHPEAGLAPPAGSLERAQMQAWLNFVATELHKLVLHLTFAPDSDDGLKAFARRRAVKNLGLASEDLGERSVLVGDRFTVADAYFFWALTLMRRASIDLSPWPNLTAYLARHGERPSVRAAVEMETAKLAA